MIIVKNAYKEIQEQLGVQQYNENDSFHLSAFVVTEQMQNHNLLYNTFTGEIILIGIDEDNQILKDRWYYIVDSISEFSILEDIREKLINKERNTSISTFTIFSTTDCNARCFYCFEKGRSKKNMSKKTALQVAQFIINKSNTEPIVIRWFGGEPLYNPIAIDTICSVLKENNVKFTSMMATNGFLFSNKNIQKICHDWNLKQVQITIDGTEEKYNKIKQIKCNPTISPFQKVLGNIELLSSNGIKVVIRLNIDLGNVEDQIELVKEILVTRFGNNKNVVVYSHPLIEALLFENQYERAQLFDKKEKLDNLLFQYELSTHTQVDNKFKLFSCISDDMKSVTILPDGEIGLCEHYSEDHFVADLNNPNKFNQDEVLFLRERMPIMDSCTDCSYYPFCIRLKCCPNSGICFNEQKQHNIRNLRRELMAEYKEYIQKHDQ